MNHGTSRKVPSNIPATKSSIIGASGNVSSQQLNEYEVQRLLLQDEIAKQRRRKSSDTVSHRY